MTTLLALYRRPEGGDAALAEFERRYATEHLPLVAQTPGLRGTRVQRVAQALGTGCIVGSRGQHGRARRGAASGGDGG